MYDIDGIEGEGLQYSKYNVGGHYSWHTDTSIENYYTSRSIKNLDDGDSTCVFNSTRANDLVAGYVERPRKLSFSLQLTDHNDYEGGNLQFQSEANLKIHNAPRKRGTIIIFDSRIRHRVTKVRSGRRDSLVGWVTGPRWR
jgi:PKHD-type hydroxylase